MLHCLQPGITFFVCQELLFYPPFRLWVICTMRSASWLTVWDASMCYGLLLRCSCPRRVIY